MNIYIAVGVAVLVAGLVAAGIIRLVPVLKRRRSVRRFRRQLEALDFLSQLWSPPGRGAAGPEAREPKRGGVGEPNPGDDAAA